MLRLFLLSLFFYNLPSFSAFAGDSLSYSGRLVNADGSPVTGTAHLKFDLAYTNNLSTILCTHDNPGVDLINGVFHAKLEFNCPSSSLKEVLEGVQTNNSIAIRVTDLSRATPKVYSFQALNSVPYSIMANFAKQLSLVGTATGQVLTWNGSAWTAADPVGTVGGVTTIAAEQGLNAVKVDDTVTIGILDGGVTAQKLHPMGATTAGQVLKWNGSNWGPGADTDTGITSETDPNVRTFARTDITGLVPESCSPHQALHYILMNDSLECVDIRAASVADTINDAETDKAPSQNAVFDALALKQNTINASSDVVMKSLKLMTDGTTWMGIKAPATSGNLFFTLPAGDGTVGQVLKTDGAGNLGWTDANAGTITGITTTAPLSGTGSSGSVNLSVNYDNATLGLNGSNALIVKDSGISNNHIAALANINWTKINKTGAVASDVGAVPTSRLISTGTGLLGGGNMSADRTLSVDVGTTAGKIVQVDGTSKLPAIDGSQLTNLLWSQIQTTSLPIITAGTGLTTTGSLASGQTLNVDVGTVAGKIVQLEAGGKLPAVDGSQLTNLGTNLGKWSDATGGIHYSSGNVGIGTTTPDRKLQVSRGGVNSSIRLDGFAAGGNFSTLMAGSDFGSLIEGGDNGQVVLALKDNDINDGFRIISGGGNFMADSIYDTTVFTAQSNGNVGIGTTSPTTTLDIRSTQPSSTVHPYRNGLLVSSEGTDVGGRIGLRTSSIGENPWVIGYRSRGTLATPTAVQSADMLLGIIAAGYDGTAYTVSGTTPEILFRTTENWTSTAHGSEIHFKTVSNGTSTAATRMSISNGGNIGIGTASPSTPLHVSTALGTTSLFQSSNTSYTNVQLNNSSSSKTWNLLTVGSLAGTYGAAGAFTIDEASGGPRFTIATGGNVGIGTTTPASKLHVASSTANTQIRVEAATTASQAEYYSVANGTSWVMGTGAGAPGSTNLGFYNSGTKMVLTPTGNLGIGTAAPASKLELRGGNAFFDSKVFVYSNSGWGAVTPSVSLAIGDNDTGINWVSDGVMQLYNNNVPVIHVGLGSVGIGSTTPGHKLDVEGNIRTSGCLYYNGGSLGTCASDERLKDEVQSFNLGLDELLGINPVYFKYNGLGGLPTDGGKQLGVIAQEIEKAAPDLIVKKKVKLSPDDNFDTEIKAVDYGAFTYVIINSIKEIHEMVTELFDGKKEVIREIASLKEDNLRKEKEIEDLKMYICQKDPEASFCKKHGR